MPGLAEILHKTRQVGAHWPNGKSVGLRIGRPGFDPRPGQCVVSLSKRHLLPKRWLRLNMTEKLFTVTLNKNQNKTKLYKSRV